MYALNNPINWRDPTGYFADTTIKNSLKPQTEYLINKTDAQLLGGFGEGHERIPSLFARFTARAEADIAFAHPLPDRQFGRIVVQGQFRVLQDQQQRRFFGLGFGNAAIQLGVTGAGGEQGVKFGTQDG